MAGAEQKRRGDPSRVEAFTDGVFAIIITILVLDIRVPSDLPEQSLADALDEVGSTLVAWLISFLLVGMYWVWHRDLFTRIDSVTRDVVWLNLLFLVPVSLVPFAAGVLGEYPDEAIALHLYGAVLIAVSFAQWGMFFYVSRRPHLLEQPITKSSRRFGLGVTAAPATLYLIAMLLAGISTTASLIVYFSVPAAYFLLITILRDRPDTAEDADDFS